MKTDLLTRKEAAEYLRVSYGTLAVWASTGRHDLPYTMVGGRAMYRKSTLDAWLKSRERTQVEV